VHEDHRPQRADRIFRQEPESRLVHRALAPDRQACVVAVAGRRFSMEANGRTQADLAHLLGSSSRASEVLSGKRQLSMGMIAKLQAEWHIPAGALVPTCVPALARAG
jgi:hypothetical protein